MNKNNSSYTTGSIRGTMLKTTLAMLAGTLAMSGYNLADTYFVGRLDGVEPLAAMGFTLPVVMLAGCVFRGMAIGVMAPMAHALGAQKLGKAAKIVTYGLIMTGIISLVISLLGLASCEYLLRGFGAEGTTLQMAMDYMSIWYIGCFTASLSMCGNDILIASGDNKVASMMMILGMVINVIVDPLFIFGWGLIPAMGIKGAALATVISQFLSGLIIWLVVWKRLRLLSFEPIVLPVMLHYWRTMIRFAIPASIGMLLMPMGMAVLTRITAQFGDAAVGAVAAVGRLEMVAFVIPMAMGISLMPMIAQNFGARKYDRIWECRRFAMRFAMFFLFLMAVIFFLLSDFLASKFTKEPEVQQIMILGLSIIPWGLAGVEVHRFAGFFYTGCNHPNKAAWLNALRIVGFLIPFSLIAAYCQSIEGLFFARLAADLLAGLVGYILARNLTWNLQQHGVTVPLDVTPPQGRQLDA
ncbi:MAG: MATE family efflux transporter [Lentisphaeria bacterium]|nr:MATE family efflux transporter [Lentisphaeria bacterium]